jgi:hypothetical protein
MECPVCDLVNPPGNSQCDCGYNFNTRTGGRRPPLRVRHRGIFWLAWFIACLALITTTSAIYGLRAVTVMLVVAPHIPLAIAWTIWCRSPFEFSPQKWRPILLSSGLLACSLSIAIFWSVVIDSYHFRNQSSRAENVCDLLNAFALVAGIFGGGRARFPLLLAGAAGLAMWLPAHFGVL